MCFGGGGNSQAAATQQQIQQQQAENQANIKAGNANIDAAFSKFDDPYFAGYSKAYTDYYNPQVDAQYRDAEGTLESGLARNGVDRSSIAATQIGRLFSDYSDRKADIANQATDAANSLRGRVADEKSNLYALNNAAADPAQANTNALAASTALVAPRAFSPLGNLFASFIAPYTAFANAYNNSAPGTGYVSPNSGATVN